jgi:magnesium transporter
MAVFTKRYHPPGTAPGTLHKPIAPELVPPTLRLTDYGPGQFEEREPSSASDCRPYLDHDTVTWIHVQGHVGAEMLGELGELFGLHVLALEDVVNTGQRPKVEAFDGQVFVVVSRPVIADGVLRTEQVSLFMGERFVVSFVAGPADPFEPVRARLRARASRMRDRGADYLLYTLLDLVVDEGFPVLEALGEQVEALELDLLENPGSETLARIHKLKRELLLLRRMLWPQREVANALARDEQFLVRPETRPYLRDCYDHTIQIMDLIETYRDMAAGMMDVYLSSASNRLNEVMRVLTVIATVFIPPTFIVGVYGMNFDRRAGPWNMPELGWPYGYLFAWAVILVLIAGMLAFFKRRKWF